MKSSRCKYQFRVVENAQFLARNAVTFGASDVSIKRKAHPVDEYVYILSFLANWDLELKLIDFARTSEEFTEGSYRENSRTSISEYYFILDKYSCWHTVNKISDSVERPNGEIEKICRNRGLIETGEDFIPGGYPFKEHYIWNSELCVEEKFITDVTTHTSCDHLKMGFVRTDDLEEEFYTSVEFWDGDLEEDNEYVSVESLSENEVNRLYSRFLFFGELDHAKSLAFARKDALRCFRFCRKSLDPYTAYSSIKDVQGLSPEYLYQRELLCSHIRSRTCKLFLQGICDWVEAAKLRETDKSASTDTGPPLLNLENLLPPVATVLPDDMVALANTYNVIELERLTGQGNRLAASFLADIHRRDIKKKNLFPNDAADFAKSVQSGYWPTVIEIEQILEKYVSFDKIYAQKLAHLDQASPDDLSRQDRIENECFVDDDHVDTCQSQSKYTSINEAFIDEEPHFEIGSSTVWGSGDRAQSSGDQEDWSDGFDDYDSSFYGT